MVSHSRTPLRAHQLRSLNQPRPVTVRCDQKGFPLALWQRGAFCRIRQIKDRWRLDDEWWRRPICRLYYLVELEDGTVETIYCDLMIKKWYRQRESMRTYGGQRVR